MSDSTTKSDVASWHYVSTLDTQGLMCPEPIMMLHKAVKQVNAGECIKVVATDPATQRDVPKFCQFLKHDLIAQHTQDALFLYLIKVG